jgi:hypothetical protein
LSKSPLPTYTPPPVHQFWEAEKIAHPWIQVSLRLSSGLSFSLI